MCWFTQRLESINPRCWRCWSGWLQTTNTSSTYFLPKKRSMPCQRMVIFQLTLSQQCVLQLWISSKKLRIVKQWWINADTCPYWHWVTHDWRRSYGIIWDVAVPWPVCDYASPLGEFNTEDYMSCAFPKHLPTWAADYHEPGQIKVTAWKQFQAPDDVSWLKVFPTPMIQIFCSDQWNALAWTTERQDIN